MPLNLNSNPSDNKKILILGAGRSSTYLIEHLAAQAPEFGWKLTVGDTDLEQVKKKTDPFHMWMPFCLIFLIRNNAKSK